MISSHVHNSFFAEVHTSLSLTPIPWRNDTFCLIWYLLCSSQYCICKHQIACWLIAGGFIFLASKLCCKMKDRCELSCSSVIRPFSLWFRTGTYTLNEEVRRGTRWYEEVRICKRRESYHALLAFLVFTCFSRLFLPFPLKDKACIAGPPAKPQTTNQISRWLGQVVSVMVAQPPMTMVS